jgi:cell division protein FtsQ
MKKRNGSSVLKKIFKTLPVFLGVVAVFYAVQLIRDIELPVVLPVNDVQVKGELHFLNQKDISTTVKNNISGGFFTVDLKHVREILLLEPWVNEVSLRRQWPAGINVYVEEKKPVAYWNNEAFISVTGDVFKPVLLDKQLNLPELSGPEGQHKNVWKFMNVLYQEMAALNFEITRLQLDDRRAWQIAIFSKADSSTDAGINVRLGRFDTEKRMRRFVRVLPALTAEMKDENKTIKVIDMRYPNGFAVQVSEA